MTNSLWTSVYVALYVVVIGIEPQESETNLHVLYAGSKFRLSMPYLSVGIIPSKHSLAHPLQGLGIFKAEL